MRTAITTIIVWALLIGIFVTGVRAISAPPKQGTVAAFSPSQSPELQRVNPDRQDLSLANK